jgi:hypothetical protein
MNQKDKPISQHHTSMNDKIYARNIPSQPLQPYLNVRPVMTKYSLLPVVDPRPDISVSMRQYPDYHPKKVFYPANTSVGPWSGYASSVNTESELRGQIFALQSASQAVYVPESNSDLYMYRFKPEETGKDIQPHPNLFQKERFDDFNPNPENIGTGLFQNCTRQQLKDITQ